MAILIRILFVVYVVFSARIQASDVMSRCVSAIVSGARAASEKMPIPGISTYADPPGISSENSAHIGGVYITEVVLRKSDNKAVSHRFPLETAPEKMPSGESAATMKAAAWDSLAHQDKLLKRVHNKFKNKKKKIAPPLPRSYGFKRRQYNKKVWESDYIEGTSVLEVLKKISSDRTKSSHQKLLEGLSLFEKSCRTVEALHANYVLHFDMKSANLIQSSNGDITVIDLAGSIYRPSEGASLYPPSYHYEKEYIPPEYENIDKLQQSDLKNIPYTFDYYTLAKSFHKKLFSGINPGDYLAHRRDPKLKKYQDFYKEYKEKVYDVMTNADPKVREKFKLKDLTDLIAKYGEVFPQK